MNTKLFLEYAILGQTFIATAAFVFLLRRHLVRTFSFVSAYLGVFVISSLVAIATLFFRKELGLSKLLAYNIYFYTRWTSFFLLSALTLFIIYGVFRHAMKPLEGLHRAGKLIFRWIFAVSVVVSVGVAVSPHIGGDLYFQSIASQIQQATSILTICLLIFVCFSIRYLGMTYRSHIFGISLGLGVMATVSLVESAFFTVADAQPLYSPVYFYSSLGACAALMVWGIYFALPEPQRKMVLLPTTSPYFLWNSISEALGDSPGEVAVAGFKPEMLAPSELEVLTAASRLGRERRDAVAAAEAQIAADLEADSRHQAFAMQQ